MTDRLDAQIAFLKEADQLKSINRSNVLLDGSRAENSAEHSWHVAVWALVFGSEAEIDLQRVISLLLVHDCVEIDAGDYPIHLDNEGQGAAETAAAERLFGLLPQDQAQAITALWLEFEAARTPAAKVAKTLDHAQPLFQVLCAAAPRADHLKIVQDNLAHGRAADLDIRWPEAAAACRALLAGGGMGQSDFDRHLSFLAEIDQLKSVTRASRLIDNSRLENSAEHSWHICMYALILAEQARPDVTIARVIQMLLIHDIVEIDAGDAPIHGHVDHAAMAVAEATAADRLFGMLPVEQAIAFRALWDEFEAAATPDARYAKAIDRIQTPIANLANGGGTWTAFRVTLQQLDARVGTPISKGAPGLWNWLRPKLAVHFGS